MSQFDSPWVDLLEQIRWPRGPVCLRCARMTIRRLSVVGRSGATRRVYWCQGCHYQFSVTVGTVLHDSHLPLETWFRAIHMVLNSERRVTVRALQQRLEIGYESAWSLNRRIRRGLQENPEFCREVALSYAATVDAAKADSDGGYRTSEARISDGGLGSDSISTDASRAN